MNGFEISYALLFIAWAISMLNQFLLRRKIRRLTKSRDAYKLLSIMSGWQSPEKKPIATGTYITTIEYGTGIGDSVIRDTVPCLYKDGWVLDQSRHDIKVVAWMPLPLPLQNEELLEN